MTWRSWIRALPAVLAASMPFLAEAKPLRIGYFYGQNEYDGEGSCRWLAKKMETAHGSKTFFFAGVDTESDTSEATAIVIPNLGELDSLDVLVLFVRRLWLNKAQLSRMKDFLTSGKGIVGIRASQYAFQSWDKGFGIDSVVLGGAYNMHGPKTGYDLEFTAAGTASPILAGVKPWRAGNSLYNQNLDGRTLAADAVVLMHGIQGTVKMPVAWTRNRSGSRIFVTTTGVQEDFQKADFQQMIMAALLWSGQGSAIGIRAIAPKGSGPSTTPLPIFSADGRILPRAKGPVFTIKP